MGGLDAQDAAPRPLTPGGGEVWLLSGAARGHWTAGDPGGRGGGRDARGGLLPLFSSPAGGGLGGGLARAAAAAARRRKGSGPAAFRLTEKFVLLLVFSAFITLCFGAIFPPDSSWLPRGPVPLQPRPAACRRPQARTRGAPRTRRRRARRGEEGAPGRPRGLPRGQLGQDPRKPRAGSEGSRRYLQKLPEEIQRDILMEKEKGGPGRC